MDLGSKIKKIRYDNNISQYDMAKIMETNRHYLSKIEKNMSIPSAEFLVKLANNFNVSIDSLLGINTNNINVLEKKKRIDKINKYCDSLSIDELDFLIGLLNVIAKEKKKK